VEEEGGETNVEGALPLGGVGGLVPGAWLEAELLMRSLSRSGALDQAAVERCSDEVDMVLGISERDRSVLALWDVPQR